MNKPIILICIVFSSVLFIPATGFAVDSPAPAIKIWGEAEHSAFTDIIGFKGKFYCAFREGTSHSPGMSGKDGVARVIVSKDTKQWKSVALLAKEGIDLRDPKMSITPDGRLMLIIGGSYYDGKKLVELAPQVSFSDENGENFSAPKPIAVDSEIRSKWGWLWRVTWHKGIGYGVIYHADSDNEVALLKTKDGINYDLVTRFDLKGSPNEATIRVMDDGEMLILIRRDGGDKHAYLGRAKAPYTDWTWNDTGVRIGGPDFIALDDGRLILGGREYLKNAQTTAVYESDRNGNVKKIFHFKSGGDTSYPGFAIHKDKLYISFYSSHEGKTSIYLGSVPINELKPQNKQ